MEKSESIINIATALIEFHKLVAPVNKGSENPFFKSKYASLPDILHAIDLPLIESGLVITQFPSGNHSLTTLLIHAVSGEYFQSTYEMKPTKDDPQGLGSCITYQRRYAIGAILNLNIDIDDDGNGASKKKDEAKATPKPEPKVLAELLPNTPEWAAAITYLSGEGTLPKVKAKYLITPKNEQKLQDQVLEIAI